jgi:peptidoglycan/LPS O-acetylase OafA/YrhL
MLIVIRRKLRGVKQKILADITEVPELLQPSYLPGMDGLRAISIIIVLLGHSLIGTWWVNYFPGQIGVDIFFVISGFLITTLLLKEKVKKNSVSLTKFYLRRILRIFPVAYLYLICLVILNLIFNLHTTLRMFLSAGLYVDNFPIKYGSNWQTGHFWSLSVEEQFYLLFPIILIKWPNKFLLLILILLVSLPFIVIIGRLPIRAYENHFFYVFVLSFTYLLGYGTSSILIGSAVSILMFKKIITIKRESPYFLSFIVFIIAILLHIKDLLNWNLLIYVFPLLISYTILLNLRSGDFFSKILNQPIIAKIGVLSYSLYIWQQLFTYDQPWKNSFKYSNSIVPNIIALFFVAYVSYTFYESKFLNLKKHFKVV